MNGRIVPGCGAKATSCSLSRPRYDPLMADANATIEALEHRLMRAWAAGDRKALRKLLSARFRLVIGGATPILLDRKSLGEAAGERWQVSAYRFGTNVYVRQVDGVGIFAAEIEMEASIDGSDASGRWWLADSWRKSTLTRSWQLLDRQLSSQDAAQGFPQMVRALQLWR
jgi:hypothetical protein